jgi:hypothetical protein
LWQNWHLVVAAPSSTLSEAPHDGQAKTTGLGIHILQGAATPAGATQIGRDGP